MKERIFGLDLLRCIAILLVLLAHTLYILNQNELSLSISIYSAVIGVEAFFVLSGFLIGSILINMHHYERKTSFASVKLFLIRRWFRTLPNYYLILLVSVGLEILLSQGLAISKLHLLSYLFFLQNSITLETNAFFGVSWSLCIEEWFYLLFPLLLLLFQRFFTNKKKSMLFTILTFLLCSLLLRMGLSMYSAIPWDAGFRKLTFTRLDSIAVGVLASYVKHYFAEFWNKHVIKTAGIGVIGFILLLIVFYHKFILNYNMSTNETGDTGWFLKTLFFTLFSFSIALFLPSLITIPANAKNYVIKFISSISLISYAIYLVHPLVIMIIFTLREKSIIPDNNLLTFCLIWFISISASYMLYHLFEKRMTAVRERFSLRKK